MARQESSSRAGRHFAPASLTRFGGFGELGIEPVWVKRPGVEVDKLRQAQAQDRFARRLRELLDAEGVTEAEFEEQLGYRPRALARKLKGYELMTLRDVLRIGDVYGAAVVAALVENAGEAIVVSESKPSSREQAAKDAQARLRDAIASLEAAADLVERLDADSAQTIAKMSEMVASIAKSQRSRRY